MEFQVQSQKASSFKLGPIKILFSILAGRLEFNLGNLTHSNIAGNFLSENK